MSVYSVGIFFNNLRVDFLAGERFWEMVMPLIDNFKGLEGFFSTYSSFLIIGGGDCSKSAEY